MQNGKKQERSQTFTIYIHVCFRIKHANSNQNFTKIQVCKKKRKKYKFVGLKFSLQNCSNVLLIYPERQTPARFKHKKRVKFFIFRLKQDSNLCLRVSIYLFCLLQKFRNLLQSQICFVLLFLFYILLQFLIKCRMLYLIKTTLIVPNASIELLLLLLNLYNIYFLSQHY